MWTSYGVDGDQKAEPHCGKSAKSGCGFGSQRPQRYKLQKTAAANVLQKSLQTFVVLGSGGFKENFIVSSTSTEYLMYMKA